MLCSFLLQNCLFRHYIYLSSTHPTVAIQLIKSLFDVSLQLTRWCSYYFTTPTTLLSALPKIVQIKMFGSVASIYHPSVCFEVNKLCIGPPRMSKYSAHLQGGIKSTSLNILTCVFRVLSPSITGVNTSHMSKYVNIMFGYVFNIFCESCLAGRLFSN